MTIKNSEDPFFEHSHPTFPVHIYNSDGNIGSRGIYLHYGDTAIKVASTLRGFKSYVNYLKNMAKEIAENYEDV